MKSMSSIDAHTPLGTQALNSAVVRAGMLGILLEHTQLYEGLWARGGN